MTIFVQYEFLVMTKKKTYIGQELKWFVDYLPDELFNSLNEDERRSYREYRRYQKEIGEGLVRIEKYQKQIETIQKTILIEKTKIKGTDEVDGWESKMKKFYDKVNHIDKNFKLNCSVEIRDRTSKSKKIKDGTLKRFNLQNPRDTYGGKEIENVYKLYGRVENSIYRKSIYLGDETEVRLKLSKLFNEDWSNDTKEKFKSKLRVLLSQYSRYHIYKNKWDGFENETHNLNSIIEWCDWCKVNRINRDDWSEKR